MNLPIEKEGGVVPIEVKATNGATVSLNETLHLKGVVYGYKFVTRPHRRQIGRGWVVGWRGD